MNMPAEPQLTSRLLALSAGTDDSDWDDVLRRSRRHRAPWAVAAAAVGVFAVLTASAFALYDRLVDFESAQPAPTRIVREYERLRAVQRIDVARGGAVVPEQARVVLHAERHGRPEPLYVAPTEDGDYCFRWGVFGTCSTRDAPRPVVGIGALDGEHGPVELSADVVDARVARVVLEYADGDRVTLPLVWVSAPIDAGFVAFEVPAERREEGRGAAAVLAYDDSGNLLARQALHRTDARWESAADGLPRAADRSRAETLFDLEASTGARWTLKTAPAPGGRLCYAYNGGGGCVSPRFPATLAGFGLGGGGLPNLCCALPEDVATVELVYENGSADVARPREGFLLHLIDPAHHERGRRLERLVFRSAAGQLLGTRAVDPARRGVYPCASEDRLDLGAGVTICP